MDTPITLSSTSTVPNKTSDFLQLNYSSVKKNDSVISIDSSFERVPVSWDANSIGFGRSTSNTSLTNIQKVSNWIKSIEGEEPKNDSIVVDVDNGISDCSTNFTEPTPVKSMDTPQKDLGADSKSVILFRCDFNKSVTAKTYYPPLNPFNRSTPVINYFKSERDTKIISTVGKISNTMDQTTKKASLKNPTNKNVIQKRLLLKRSGSNQLIHYPSQINSKFSIENESYCVKANDEKSDGSSDAYEVPLSPESRKKELCSYLQLMNPADKKERFILQNRRSTRVRNLAAMQEKKEMERKIKESEEDTDLSEKEVEKCPTLKSFKELNIRVEKSQLDAASSEEKTVESDFEKDIFCFPFPSKDLTEKVNDFDSVMSKLVPRFKRICKLKNIKLKSKMALNKSVPKNKENLIKNMVRTKRNEMNLTKNVKSKKINNVKNNATKKGHKFKEILKSKYKKPLTLEKSPSLRSTGKLRKVASKKLIGKKETEVKAKRNLVKRPLRSRQQVDKVKKVRPRKNSAVTSPKRDVKSKTISSQCEIVTVTENNEDHVDLENFMDDMIDFNNLSEEHKKCLIESRILSTKPMTRLVSTNSSEERMSENSFYSLQAISPLYGFNKSDVNEVKKICEAYKNSSFLKHCPKEVMQEYFLNEVDVKVEEPEMVDCVEFKTEVISSENPEEKLEPPIVADKIEQEFIILNDEKFAIENPQNPNVSSEAKETIPNGVSLQEHDYAGIPNGDNGEENEDKEIDVVTVPNKNLPVGGYIEINPRQIEKKSKFELLPYNKSVEMKSLHRSLQYLKRKNQNHNALADHTFARDWELDSPKQKSRKQSHYISINKENGAVLKAFYIDYNLIVCQEYVVSFWMQTPLGNVLGSQNMWIPRGQTQRLVLNSKCIQKESTEMVIAMETHVAYIELWTKEHKSDIREGPVADVFATVYFWKQRQNGLEKKVLQLENINGFADDVQYSVMKCSPKIIVSWHSANEDDTVAKRTFIHAYQLAPDYQTVSNIYDIEPVDHYVSSLHNIEDCDNLIMGCGENKITLWNVEYGYIVATIELSEIKSPLSTLWVKCDRGFLFALQQCVDRELRLIAINGINHSWKKLASYNPPEGFDRLRGVCIDNGLLLSFYDQGILCWKAETGEPVEETNLETEIIPSGKYVILLEDNQILVKHAITHLMSMSVDET